MVFCSMCGPFTRCVRLVNGLLVLCSFRRRLERLWPSCTKGLPLGQGAGVDSTLAWAWSSGEGCDSGWGWRSGWLGGSCSVDSHRKGFVLELRRFNAGGRRSTLGSMGVGACVTSVVRLMPCCSEICRLAMGRGIAVAESVTEADVVSLGAGGASSGCGSAAAAVRKGERCGLERASDASFSWLNEKVTVLLLGPALFGAGAGRNGCGGMQTSACGRFHKGVVESTVLLGSNCCCCCCCSWSCCSCCCDRLWSSLSMVSKRLKLPLVLSKNSEPDWICANVKRLEYSALTLLWLLTLAIYPLGWKSLCLWLDSPIFSSLLERIRIQLAARGPKQWQPSNTHISSSSSNSARLVNVSDNGVPSIVSVAR